MSGILGLAFRAAAGAALLIASPLLAKAPVQYALGKVEVTGANPVGKLVLLERKFGPGCELPQAELNPFSGYLGADTQLKLTVISCPEQAARRPPRSAGPRPATPRAGPSFESWEATLSLALPDLTGVYPFELACRFQRIRPEVLKTTLYMTWRKSFRLVTLPRGRGTPFDWYAKACAWAAGLRAEARAEEVASRILAGAFAYGQSRWHYGYGVGREICDFCLTGRPPGGSACLCTCAWYLLLDDESPCTSGDCFPYTAALQNLSAIMGVLMSQKTISGDCGLGFTTRPGLLALDPRFPGNLICGAPPGPCAYAFPVHSLGVVGGRFYDLTFGRTYTLLDELIGQHVTRLQGGNLVLRESLACFQGHGYGDWGFYGAAPSGTTCPRNTPRQPPAAFAPGPVERHPVSIRNEDRAEVLAVDLVLDVRQPGSYFVGGALFADGRIVSQRSSILTQRFTVESVSADAPGPRQVRLLFSGDDVVEMAYLGPLTVRAWLADEKGLLSEKEARLMPLSARELQWLGERQARFGPALKVVAEPVVREGKILSLELKVPVVVRDEGTLLLLAAMSTREEQIAHTDWIESLSRGEHLVTLQFPSDEVEGRPASDDYRITLVLQWGAPSNPVDSLEIGAGRFDQTPPKAVP